MEIKISNLEKVYKSGKKALKGISINIGKEMFGLLGANGAGKTTLMRILVGMLKASKGEVKFKGYNLPEERDKLNSKIGYLPQTFGLYPDLNAYEFLEYIGFLYNINNKKMLSDRILHILDLVNLKDVAKVKVKNFSGGMKRRLGIAQALLNDPELIIVDEPTAGLDPEERIKFRNLLSEIAGEKTVILSTHIVADIESTCKSLVVLDEGNIIYSGTPQELIRKAEGLVWKTVVETNSEIEDIKKNFDIVSRRQVKDGFRVRFIGKADNNPFNAEKSNPSLEEGYLILKNRYI